MKKVELDSRLIEEGDIFIAIECKDVALHVEEAIQRGASIIISENKNLGNLYTTDSRLIASKLAAFCYNSQPQKCVAITGTNGKSSTAHFLSEILRYNNIDTATLGTNGLYINRVKKSNSKLTTPDSVILHKTMASIKEEYNIDHLIFEASSHALDQKRLHSVKIKTAVLTNFASDHLDYHKTKENYFHAKLKLFTEIGGEYSVFSKDDPYVFKTLNKLNHKNIITFGYAKNNDIYANNVNQNNNQITFDLYINGNKFKDLYVNLLGEFQLSNILCSIASALSLGLKETKIINVLKHLKTLEGRMEFISSYNGGNVYIDFAHTEKAFHNSLLSFRKACKAGKLIAIFGCGGERDKSKRSLFGKIANTIADISIVTDDNPRHEDPQIIRREIIKSCTNAAEIADRKEAIKYGLSILQNGDFLIILGKGHETTQICGDTIIEQNDKENVLKCISELDDTKYIDL